MNRKPLVHWPNLDLGREDCSSLPPILRREADLSPVIGELG